MAKKKKGSTFTNDSTLQCPECERDIHVGPGGEANLQHHIRSRACKAAVSSKRELQNTPSIRSFFAPKILQNPPTTGATPLLHSAVQPSSPTNELESKTVPQSAMRREPCLLVGSEDVREGDEIPVPQVVLPEGNDGDSRRTGIICDSVHVDHTLKIVSVPNLP